MNINVILNSYAHCALWASTDEDMDPLDENYDLDDFAPDTWAKMREDVTDFVQANEAILKASGLSSEQIGHDFWLTRNGHGAGFWDRGLGAVGEELTILSKLYQSVFLEVGDDDKIYAY